jgi:ribosome-associated toxin RatA of RatAB toxin-antitoxin module
MDVRKTVLVGHSAERMFDVIEAAEHYPAFLPWCAGAVIAARDDAEVVADLRVDYHGIRFGFRTRNPKRRPHWMAIHLERGPFRHFDGEWALKELAADGCRIDFMLRYEFDSTAMSKLARPIFDRIANTLVDRFVARADAVYADGGVPAAAPGPAPGVVAPLPLPLPAPASALPPAPPGPDARNTADPTDPVNRSNPP